MFARRGGYKYLKQDLKFQKFLLDNRFINIIQFLKNILFRSMVRIMPNRLRVLVYKEFLRK